MNFDPQIVSQAKAFVNDLHAGKPARVPRMPFAQWPLFMTTVQAEQSHAMATLRPAWRAFLSTLPASPVIH